MPTECPQCLSPRTRERHLGKQAGTTIGAFVGALSGALTSTKGYRLIIPIRHTSLTEAIVRAITGALSGSAAGAAIGQAFDAELLDSHLCLSCGNTFRPTRFERPMWDAN
jgi:hypothetical protein